MVDANVVVDDVVGDTGVVETPGAGVTVVVEEAVVGAAVVVVCWTKLILAAPLSPNV